MKFCGTVGYVTFVEKARGVHVPQVTERKYYGDVLKDNRRWDTGQSKNDNLVIGNRFSILADGYALSHLGEIAYVEWMGSKWRVSNIDIERPRLILSVGGLYNGTSEET